MALTTTTHTAEGCAEEEDGAHCLAVAGAIASTCPTPQYMIVLLLYN